jgi:hypothetical protein
MQTTQADFNFGFDLNKSLRINNKLCGFRLKMSREMDTNDQRFVTPNVSAVMPNGSTCIEFAIVSSSTILVAIM